MKINQKFQFLSFFLEVHRGQLYEKRLWAEFFHSMELSSMDFLQRLLHDEEFFLGDLEIEKYCDSRQRYVYKNKKADENIGLRYLNKFYTYMVVQVFYCNLLCHP